MYVEPLLTPIGFKQAQLLVLAYLKEQGIVGGAAETAAQLITAHACLETGFFKSCYNNNWGNEKAALGEAKPYTLFKCGEELPVGHVDAVEGPYAKIARKYLTKGGKAMLSMLFTPPHPQCRFKAYTDAQAGCNNWLATLFTNYKEAITVALAGGSAYVYAAALKKRYYFTADLDQYAQSLGQVLAEIQATTQTKLPTVTTPPAKLAAQAVPIWPLAAADTTAGARLARIYTAMAADPEYHKLLEQGCSLGDSTCAQVARAGWWHAGLPGMGKYTSGQGITESVVAVCKKHSAWGPGVPTVGSTYYLDIPGQNMAHIANVIDVVEFLPGISITLKTVEGGQGPGGHAIGTFLRRWVWQGQAWWQGTRQVMGCSMPQNMPIPVFTPPVVTPVPVIGQGTKPTTGPVALSAAELWPWAGLALVLAGWFSKFHGCF